jgi:hypothetical protein
MYLSDNVLFVQVLRILTKDITQCCASFGYVVCHKVSILRKHLNIMEV